MNKVSVLLLIFSVFSQILSYSQQTEEDRDQLDISGLRDDNPETRDIKTLKKLKTNVEVGTSFMYSPRNFYGPSYYVAPNLSYLVTPRFSLSAGIGYEYASIYPLYNIPDAGNTMLPMTKLFLYTKGNYLLNERLMLTGSVYKSMIDVPRLSQNSRPFNYNYQGVDVGIQYQINKNFSIGFHMRMNNMSFSSSGNIPPDALVPATGF